MQYAICMVLVLCGLIFVNSRYAARAILLFDWILFTFARDNADYTAYLYIYKSASSSLKDVSGYYGDIEIGYQILCSFCRDILCWNYEMFRGIIATITLFMLYNTVKRYTKNYAMVMALFTIFPLLISIVQFRSWIAFAIVFWGIRYLEKNEIKEIAKYILCVVVATTIQASSIFFLIFLLCKVKDERKLLMAVLVWCLIARFFIIGIVLRLSAIATRFEKYIRTTSLITQIMMLAILLVMYGLAFQSRKTVQVYRDSIENSGLTLSGFNLASANYADLAVKISILGFVIWPFTSLTMETIRIVRYLFVFGFILYSIPITCNKRVPVQYLARFVSVGLAFSLMLYYCCRGEFLDTVFFAGFEKNYIFQLLFG